MQDRDRIAADLQDKVIQQVFAIGMNLHSTATLATQSEVRKRILTSADGLDQVLRLTRDAVFGLEQHLAGPRPSSRDRSPVRGSVAGT